MLAAEQLRRPTLTLAQLWVELSLLYKRVEIPCPKESYAPGDSNTLTSYSAVTICAAMDGVDVKFEACVVVDVFPLGICLGPQELKCYKINHQEPFGEARIDVLASLVVSFVVAHTQVSLRIHLAPCAYTFERAVVKTKLITNELEPLKFQNVVLNAAIADASLHNVVFLEDSVATVSEAGHVFIRVMNLTSNPQQIRKGSQLSNLVPVSLVSQDILQWTPTQQFQQTEADNDQFAFVNKFYEEMNYNTDSQLPSSKFEILYSTDPTEEGLSEREIRKHTDAELMAPIQGPESQLQEVKDLWGAKASTSLENILTEFDDLFMKHKADIGRCTIAKHPVEVEPDAVPHREGARRMSAEKAERAN